uniref:S1 motif domain-containing protein n=1 Tax=Steinernema glaseri TaxID=37863 RepID=A0A1I7ZCY4_9BILA
MDSPTSSVQSRLVQSDSEQVDQAVVIEDRGYTSDNPALLQKQNLQQKVSVDHDQLSAPMAQDSSSAARTQSPKSFERGTIVLVPNLSRHDPAAFLRVGDTMGFLVMAHITPENFESCVKCLRSLIEASLDGGKASSVAPATRRPLNPLRSSDQSYQLEVLRMPMLPNKKMRRSCKRRSSTTPTSKQR